MLFFAKREKKGKKRNFSVQLVIILLFKLGTYKCGGGGFFLCKNIHSENLMNRM
jgi:hypothetical protein